jgi:hypothetical protein
MEELDQLYRDALDLLPTEEETSLTLDARMCPVPPAELESAGLIVRGIAEGHIYSDSVRVEVVEFFAEKETYRALALLIFSSLFHSARTVLHLRHEDAPDLGGMPVATVVVDDPRRPYPEPFPSELRLVPVAYDYWPRVRTGLNPVHDEYATGLARRPTLPEVVWSNDDGTWAPSQTPRTTVHGFGLAEGAATFAALLLDIGLPGSLRTRFCLEGPAGYQSVTSHSAEMRLWIGHTYS